MYHVMCRGDRRAPIFLDDEDRLRFVRTLGEACGRAGWRIHTHVLMGNHYNFLLETPQANLVRGMHWFQTSCTARHNARHKQSAHLFQGRYKAVLIDPEQLGHFLTVSDYIHLNPARAGLVRAPERLQDYRWSSLPLYGSRASRRPGWMEIATVFGELGLRDRPSGRQEGLGSDDRARGSRSTLREQRTPSIERNASHVECAIAFARPGLPPFGVGVRVGIGIAPSSVFPSHPSGPRHRST